MLKIKNIISSFILIFSLYGCELYEHNGSYNQDLLSHEELSYYFDPYSYSGINLTKKDVENINSFLNKQDVSIRHLSNEGFEREKLKGHQRAYYERSTQSITLRDDFSTYYYSAEEYYTCLFHELMHHAYNNNNRMKYNGPGVKWRFFFQGEYYSVLEEEVIADIGAMILLDHFGLDVGFYPRHKRNYKNYDDRGNRDINFSELTGVALILAEDLTNSDLKVNKRVKRAMNIIQI